MTRAPLVELLAWDTDFFGIRVGRVTCEDPDEADLDDAVEQAEASEIACLGLEVVPGAATRMESISRRGFELVDVRVVYETPPGWWTQAESSSAATLRPARGADLLALRPVLERLAPWSRLAVDRHFGVEAALRMYEVWVERATCSRDELCLVAEAGAEVVGLVTCRSDREATLGLIGVTVGGSVGRLLLDAAGAWALERSPRLVVRTQARNVTALRFYASAGLLPREVRYLFHRGNDRGR